MSMILVIHVVLFSVVMAGEQFVIYESGHPKVSVFPVTSIPNPLSQYSTVCLLQSQPLIRRDDYTYTPGIGAHKLHTRAAVWNEARLICEEEGGHLAIINSIAEANAIIEIFNNLERITGSAHPELASIGFHDLYKQGEHVTIHGQSLAKAGFTRWFTGNPSGGTERCGSFHETGGFNDISCGDKFGFICELPIY